MSFDGHIGVLFHPGPGDILRFLHGFCEITNSSRSHGTIYCLPKAWKDCNKLISHCRGIKPVLIDATSLKKLLLGLDEEKIVFHAFESDYFQDGRKRLPEVFTNNMSCKFEQMDRFQEQRFMCHHFNNHFVFSPRRERLQKTALVFIRNSNIVPERNITSSILSSIVDCCRTFNFSFQFAGSPSQGLVTEVSHNDSNVVDLYPNSNYPDYYLQIEEYSRYAFAVGMNSGALDLAAVAGIPIIRIGDYHHTLSHQGVDYNEAITSNFTINVLSNSERDISNITHQKIQTCFELLFKCLYQERDPHLLLETPTVFI